MFRRRFLFALTAVTAGLLYVACGPDHTFDSDPFIVHEWGTFTSMQGIEGETLEGMQHESERLPAFVHSRTDSVASPYAPHGDTSFEERATNGTRLQRVRTKMETPILYFYSKSMRRISVTVNYVGGWMTQWFPRANAPEDTPERLTWDIDVLPAHEGTPDHVPTVADNDPWSWARNVSAAYVRTDEGEAERYLFYRGLGGDQSTVTVAALPNGLSTVRNTSPWEIPSAFVVEMDDDSARFAALGALAAGSHTFVNLNESQTRTPAAAVEALEAAVLTALVDSGLYEDEAMGMVRTWSATWFAARGTRVVYIVPRAHIDTILPLTIRPVPDELARVIVGRQEYLAPERHAEIASSLRELAAFDPALTNNARRDLARQGRFLEGSVRAVMAANPGDARVQLGGRLALQAY